VPAALDCEGRPEMLPVLALLEASDAGLTVDELARTFRLPDDYPARKQRVSTVLQQLRSSGHARTDGQVPSETYSRVNRWVITASGRDRLYGFLRSAAD
jgi:hypothetical protein